jgi:acyl-coenzyme A thioesterase PaaI-like protein
VVDAVEISRLTSVVAPVVRFIWEPLLRFSASALSVALNSEFVGAGALGVPVYGTGRVVRDTKSMVFVQGQLDQEDQPILVFSSVARRITPRINVG